MQINTIMTNSSETFFKDDPWLEIDGPSYPQGRQLYQNDDRFWVSKNESGYLQFFIHIKEFIEIKSIDCLADIEINISRFGANSSRLICTLLSGENELSQKFSIVAKDIAYYCSKDNDREIFLSAQKRIESWANFLRPTKKGLNNSEFVGLWGELYTISEILMHYHKPADVIRFWIGPEGKKKDLTLNSIEIEIKTSMSGSSNKINISSIDQLEVMSDKLYLLHINASPSTDDAGFSLEDFYEKCIKTLSEELNIQRMFQNKLSRLYFKASEAQLKDKFSIHSINLFDVRDDFPMIRRKNISPGVASAKYKIFTAYLDGFNVTNDMEGIIKNG